MKIAVTSQNRKLVTKHAGRCRRFWVYRVEEGQVADKSLLELSKEQSFHDSEPDAPHPHCWSSARSSRFTTVNLMHLTRWIQWMYCWWVAWDPVWRSVWPAREFRCRW